MSPVGLVGPGVFLLVVFLVLVVTAAAYVVVRLLRGDHRDKDSGPPRR